MFPGTSQDFDLANFLLYPGDTIFFGVDAHNDSGFSECNDWAYLRGEIIRLDSPAQIGETIRIPAALDFTVEQYTQQEFTIRITNSGDNVQTATLEVSNPNSDLGVSLQSQNPIDVVPGETVDVSLLVDAASAAVGVYDGILLGVTVDDGSTLYSNITVYVTEPGAAELPDLTVNSEGIGFTSGDSDDPVTLTATVRNRGQSSASNVEVEFYELDTLLGSTVIDTLPADGAASASITVPSLSSGDHLVRVVIDPMDKIVELDETNNEASQIIRPEAPGLTEGNILVTGSLPSTVYTDSLFRLTGRAVYDVTVDDVRYTNYVVKGGSVEVTMRAEDGTEWVYGGIHTNTDGNFTKSLLAPTIPGTYRLFMTVTDKTFVGTRELIFTVVEQPDLPQPPPPPPTSSGTGEWTFEDGEWTWTWFTLPVSGPVPESDLRVFSENIYFSKDNPTANEEITLFAEILYWASSTTLVAEDIPVNFYATYPSTDKELIGQTTIPSMSVAAPGNGSRYVYATWKNPGDGIYIMEVEIDPSYGEENMLNNAATRAIIVGQLASNQGVISGQVTDAWGGVDNVVINVFDTNDQRIGSTVTDATGFYLVQDVPVGAMEVRIDTPAGYQADADTITANVADQSVTEVDFYLTEQVDTEPPVLSLPDDIIAEATGPDGVVVTYDTSATDAVDGEVAVDCMPISGSTFALGTTSVTCTANDAAGNSAEASFNVTVVDTTPPAVTVPGDITKEATSPAGAMVTYSASATDTVDGALTPTCTPASGSTFTLGSTPVTCTAIDAAGNAASGSFTVTVQDTTPPVISASLVQKGEGDERESDEGRFKVTFSVTDIVDPAPEASAFLRVPDWPPIPVDNGQTVEFEYDDEGTEVEQEGSIFEIEAPSLSLEVTATDISGNTAVAIALPIGLGPDNDLPGEVDD